MHTNLIANPPTLEPELRHSVLSKYNTNGPETEFPYNNEEEIFDADKIIEALMGHSEKVAENKKVKVLISENGL